MLPLLFDQPLAPAKRAAAQSPFFQASFASHPTLPRRHVTCHSTSLALSPLPPTEAFRWRHGGQQLELIGVRSFHSRLVPIAQCNNALSFVVVTKALNAEVKRGPRCTENAPTSFLSQFLTVVSLPQLLQQLRQHCDDLTRCMGEQAVMDMNGTVIH